MKSSTPAEQKATHSAGAFDIRNVIGLLLSIYGVILVLSTWFLDPGVNPETGAIKNATYNLYTGVGLLVAGLVFFVWTKAAPITVPDSKE